MTSSLTRFSENGKTCSYDKEKYAIPISGSLVSISCIAIGILGLTKESGLSPAAAYCWIGAGIAIAVLCVISMICTYTKD